MPNYNGIAFVDINCIIRYNLNNDFTDITAGGHFMKHIDFETVKKIRKTAVIIFVVVMILSFTLVRHGIRLISEIELPITFNRHIGVEGNMNVAVAFSGAESVGFMPAGADYTVTVGKLDNDVSLAVRGFVFKGEKGISDKVFNSVYEDIERLSPNMVRQIRSITVVEDDLVERFSLELGDEVDRVAGVATGRDIYLRASRYDEYSLIHECMHVMDYVNRTDGMYWSDNEEWKALFKANTRTHDDCWYLRIQNGTEYFASVAQLWYMAPEYTAEMFPQESAMIEELFGGVFDGREEYKLPRLK